MYGAGLGLVRFGLDLGRSKSGSFRRFNYLGFCG